MVISLLSFIPRVYRRACSVFGYIPSSSPTQMNKIDIQLYFCKAVAVTAVHGVLQCEWTEWLLHCVQSVTKSSIKAASWNFLGKILSATKITLFCKNAQQGTIGKVCILNLSYAHESPDDSNSIKYRKCRQTFVTLCSIQFYSMDSSIISSILTSYCCQQMYAVWKLVVSPVPLSLVAVVRNVE